MANPTDQAHNTQTATIGTEHSLTTITVAGTFQLQVDLVNMVSGDVVEIRWKSKTLTSGTETQGDCYTFYGPQTAKCVSDLIANINTDSSSVEFTLKQIAGTGRNYPWQVFKYT